MGHSLPPTSPPHTQRNGALGVKNMSAALVSEAVIKRYMQKHLVGERLYSSHTSRSQCASEESRLGNSNRNLKAGLLVFLFSINCNMEVQQEPRKILLADLSIEIHAQPAFLYSHAHLPREWCHPLCSGPSTSINNPNNPPKDMSSGQYDPYNSSV